MEVCQVLVVYEDLDREGRTVEIVSPGLQGMDNCKELMVIDVVVLFSWNEQLEEVGAWVPVSIGIGLKEDGTRGILGGVGGDGKRLGEVGEMEDWS